MGGLVGRALTLRSRWFLTILLLVAPYTRELALYDLRFLRPERQALPAPAPPSHQSHRPGQKRPRNESNPPGHAGNGVVEAAVAGPSPVLRIEGHVNSFSTELGLDVWKDEWVAVGTLISA